MLLGLLAVFAASAIASSVASAHAYKVEGTEITKTFEVEGKDKGALLESKIAGLTIAIKCEKSTFKGTIEVGGKSTGTIEFTECKVYEVNSKSEKVLLSACKVAEPVTAKVKDELTEKPVGERFTPASGTEFTKIEIKGETCTVKGSFEVTGEQTCKLPGGETEAEQHTIECIKSGSNLKLKKEVASFEATEEEVKIKGGGKKWSAV
jgi:hypothetical protein